MRTGAEVLAAWLRQRAARADEVFALEEALLSGRFARYAARRLLAFGLARAWSTALHVLELTVLFEIFSARPFVASLALQNGTLVVDALFWGALEALRRRLRELGKTSEAAGVLRRWLVASVAVAAFAIAVPAAFAARAYVTGATESPMLHLYAIACGVRLAADVVLRTYYSGVYAHGRVHRPVASVFVGPLVLVVGTLLLWEPLGGYSFPLALIASTAASRGLLFVFVHRAYRALRVPQPVLRLHPRALFRRSRIAGAQLRDAAFAAAANLSTRLTSVVLLALAIPSLREPALDEEADLELVPLALALHLAAPLLLVTSQWGFVFYHDWKRLEREAALALAAHLGKRLFVTAIVVGGVASLATALLVLVFVPFDVAAPTLLALAMANFGMALWTSLQLRGFAHGEFARQVASALAMLAALVLPYALTEEPHEDVPLAVGVAPWLAALAYAAIGIVAERRVRGPVETLAAWVRALERTRAPVIVWEARAADTPAQVHARIDETLQGRGACFRSGTRLVWFEPREEGGTPEAWLARLGGAVTTLAHVAEASDGKAAWRRVVASGRAAPPSGDVLESAITEHRRLFPDGFVLRLGKPAPATFLALAPSTRQAVWRDALAADRRRRGRSGWCVVPYAPDGVIAAIFAARRPVAPERMAAFRAHIAQAGVRFEGGRDAETRGAARVRRAPNVT
jgi:hypothetical protein